MRFVVLVLLVLLAVWLIRRALRGGSVHSGTASDARPRTASDDELVRCARCGLHLPRADATARDGAFFCGEEHARLGASR
jgi:uncharacterized protein